MTSTGGSRGQPSALLPLPAFLSPEPGQPGRWKLSWQKTVALAVLRVGVLPVTCHSPLPSLGETLEQRFGETLSPFIRLCRSAPRAPSSRAQSGAWEMANVRLTAGARDAPFASAAPAPAMAQNAHSYWPRKPGRIPWAACATGTTTPFHPHRPSEGCTRRGSPPPSTGAGIAPESSAFCCGPRTPAGEKGWRRGTVWPDTCAVPFRAEWASAARLGRGPLPPYHLISASV